MPKCLLDTTALSVADRSPDPDFCVIVELQCEPVKFTLYVQLVELPKVLTVEEMNHIIETQNGSIPNLVVEGNCAFDGDYMFLWPLTWDCCEIH